MGNLSKHASNQKAPLGGPIGAKRFPLFNGRFQRGGIPQNTVGERIICPQPIACSTVPRSPALSNGPFFQEGPFFLLFFFFFFFFFSFFFFSLQIFSVTNWL